MLDDSKMIEDYMFDEFFILPGRQQDNSDRSDNSDSSDDGNSSSRPSKTHKRNKTNKKDKKKPKTVSIAAISRTLISCVDAGRWTFYKPGSGTL